MSHVVESDLRAFQREGDSIEYGSISKAECDAAAQLYLEAFPERVRQWFIDSARARCFYGDLMHLLRIAHGDEFIAARYRGRLIGYLILMWPDRRLLPAFFQEGMLLQVAGNLLRGRYGFSLRTLAHSVKAILASPSAGDQHVPALTPHVYLVVVAKAFHRRGIGSALLERARNACGSRFNQIWLYVDVGNSNAIRL